MNTTKINELVKLIEHGLKEAEKDGWNYSDVWFSNFPNLTPEELQLALKLSQEEREEVYRQIDAKVFGV